MAPNEVSRGVDMETVFTREEVAQHDKVEDAWIIVDDKVYDVTDWSFKHPGGRVLLYYRGQDATEPVYGFHSDIKKTKKFMAPLCVGRLDNGEYLEKVPPAIKDFRVLRQKLESDGTFDPKPLYYFAHLASIFLMEATAVYLLLHGFPLWVAAIFLATAQIQFGWTQHDFGHCAVFESCLLNQVAHYFVIGFCKGASSWWWKSRHNRHHAKTNQIKMDPDMHVEPLFSFSTELVSTRPWKFFKALPFQKYYWWLFGPPVVTTLLFFYENAEFIAKRGRLADLLAVASFYLRYDLIFRHYVGLSASDTVLLYVLLRVIESHWFTWVTSMNHLPMPKTEDKRLDWINLQLNHTQNVEPGLFNDWFTGRLNYQIEHHLFPNMPQHSLGKVAPMIKDLCNKHGVEYRCRSLLRSMIDVSDMLGEVAEWYSKTSAAKRASASSRKPAVKSD